MRLFLVLAFGVAFVFQLVALSLYQLPFEKVGRIGPDFVLLLVIYAAAFDRPRRGLQAAVAAACVSEIFSVQPWGAYALPYILSAWVATRCGRRGWGDDPAPRFLVILTAVTVALGARALLLWALGASFLSPGIDTALVMVVYNGILGAVIFSLLEPIRAQLVAPPRRRRLQ